MSLIIKGMELPEGCYQCPILYDDMYCPIADCSVDDVVDDVGLDLYENRMPACPLVYVSDTEHIDRTPN